MAQPGSLPPSPPTPWSRNTGTSARELNEASCERFAETLTEDIAEDRLDPYDKVDLAEDLAEQRKGALLDLDDDD